MPGSGNLSHSFEGQLSIELMLIQGINDDDDSLEKYIGILPKIKYEKLYLSTPVRPPAEKNVKAVDRERMKKIAEMTGGISIDLLASQGFHSEIKDDNAAILSIIKRHPMNQYEIDSFLDTRNATDKSGLFNRLSEDETVDTLRYKGYNTYRLKTDLLRHLSFDN